MGAQCDWGWGRAKEIYSGSKTRVQTNERTGSRAATTRLTTTQCTDAGEIQGTLVLAFCFSSFVLWIKAIGCFLLFIRVIGCSSHRLFPNCGDKVFVLFFGCVWRKQEDM